MKLMALLVFLTLHGNAQEANQLGPLVLQAIRGLMEWQPRARGYEYDYRTNEKKLASDGSEKESHSAWINFQFIDQRRWGMVKERDGVPTTEEQRQTQRSKFLASVASVNALPEATRQKRKAEAEKKRKEQMEFLEELPNAFDFKVVERTKIGSRDISVIEFTPRQGFKPAQMRSKLFTKVRGKVWLDAAEAQAAKLTADVFEDLSLGGFLANLGKGTHFEFEQNRIDDSRWLPVRIYSRVMAKVLVFKSFNTEELETYANFGKALQK